ncbi:hypothetical protein OTU49_004106, partial [Cherax quadricarinatus]
MEQKTSAYGPYNPPQTGPPPPYSATPPPLGFQGPSQQSMYMQQQQQPVYVQQHGSTTVVTTQPLPSSVVLVTGANCPACRAGFLRSEFTCCGIFLAICFFPIGMLCCFLMMERRCSNCRLTF